MNNITSLIYELSYNHRASKEIAVDFLHDLVIDLIIDHQTKLDFIALLSYNLKKREKVHWCQNCFSFLSGFEQACCRHVNKRIH